MSSTLAAIRAQPAQRSFYARLGAITLVGLVLRIGYVLLVTVNEKGKFYDAFWYGATANGLASGEFFRVPLGTAPTAAHPPLTSLILGAVSVLFGEHVAVQRIAMAVIGASVVLCVGLIGRAVAGPRVGLLAACLAAAAPNFWIPSGILMSEALSMLLMALILLATLRTMRSPTLANAALLGVACASEALVRAELILFVPTLLLPAVLAARRMSARRRIGLAMVGMFGAAAVITPWVARNLVTFEKPTSLSTGIGNALLGANCPQVYAGPGLGSWHLDCLPRNSTGDESVVSSQETHAAITYAARHGNRLPVVVLARIGRLWDFYDPIQMVNDDVNEGRPALAAGAGLAAYYALLPFAFAGVALLRRQGLRYWFLMVPAGVLSVIAGLFYGSVRFRAPAEVCLVVLAAPALVAATQWFGRRVQSPGQSALAVNSDDA